MKVKTVRLTTMQIAWLIALLEGFYTDNKVEQEEVDSMIAELRRVEER